MTSVLRNGHLVKEPQKKEEPYAMPSTLNHMAGAFHVGVHLFKRGFIEVAVIYPEDMHDHLEIHSIAPSCLTVGHGDSCSHP